jgi:8-oxo-dGTP diphosphatase
MYVVGAAVIDRGLVLCARRSAPAELAGRWEFPGGKVEPAESEQAALRRECREELGVEIEVGALLGEVEIRAGLTLRLYLATLTAGEPMPLQDHDELRWVDAAGLDALDWLPADRPLLPAVHLGLSAAF